MNSVLGNATSIGIAFGLALGLISPASSQAAKESGTGFQVVSATFKNDTTLPLSMVDNIVSGGSNICSLGGSPGQDQSPQLSWTNAPRETRSFVVVAFDTTANFTHWGMYNIGADATGLAANAGVAGSTYGNQILNDFLDPNYDGPCPPSNLPPNVHHYVFTVYALGSELDLPSTTNFPANAETLFRALIHAAMRGDLLDSASITGFYSTTPTR